MTWNKKKTVLLILSTLFIIGIILLFISSTLAITSEDIRRNLGLARVPSWHPDSDTLQLANGDNTSFRFVINYYNNGSNLTNPQFNMTMNFTEQLELLGVNTTLYTLDDDSVRIYEVNQYGECINESGVANGTCNPIAFSQES